MKIIILFLCLILLTTGSGLGATFQFEEKEDVPYMEPTKEHPKITGLILIGWSIYAGWLSYTMLTGDFYIKEGDWKLVGGCLLATASVTFFWGISLVF